MSSLRIVLAFVVLTIVAGVAAFYLTPEPAFIELPPLGSNRAAVRALYGRESKEVPDDERAGVRRLVFLQKGYEISASFFENSLERVFFVPNSDDGFSEGQLKKMSDFYGQGKKWHLTADTEYMKFHRRDDDAAYYIFNGIAQFKTVKFDKLQSRKKQGAAR